MNAPLPEHLRLRGASPGDSTNQQGASLGRLEDVVLQPQELVLRRIILIQDAKPSSNHRQAYQELARFKKRFGIKPSSGMTFLVEDPDFRCYPILAWSAIHGDYFIWADKALVFDSSTKLRERQGEYPEEFERHEQTKLLACDVEQCDLPAHRVNWRVLVLLKRVQPGG
ncbi:MAG: hypothetical protein IPJ68_02475 [Candidatus Moraniibacteriota bacterium]|nr:MAG: hypothetical protein IPJ68_02475 [Candidatus Moranbacteria bacterium]